MNILFLVSRFPYPLEKGDKLRAFQHIKSLHSLGHTVHLIALSDVAVSPEDRNEVSTFCASVHVLNLTKPLIAANLAAAFFRNLPLQVAYFYSSVHRKKIQKRIREIKPDLVYCQLIRTALFVKGMPGLVRVIDYQDAFSEGTRQRMEDAPFLFRPLFNREFSLVRQFERDAYSWFDGHLIISQQDLDAMNLRPDEQVAVLPNGVDTDWFKPVPAGMQFDISFVGNMNYPPNIDSVEFLVREIMPVVWKELPGTTVRIAGANPHKRVSALASGQVTVTGWIDDIRTCYGSTRVFMAPMRIGTGLQNKLLEAMSSGIATITTPMSAAPLGARDGIEILIGDTAHALAAHAIRLLRDEHYRNELGAQGRQFVTRHYSLVHAAELLSEELNRAVGRHTK